MTDVKIYLEVVMTSYIQYLLPLLFLATFAVYFTGTRIYGKRAAIIYVTTVVFAPTVC